MKIKKVPVWILAGWEYALFNNLECNVPIEHSNDFLAYFSKKHPRFKVHFMNDEHGRTRFSQADLSAF